MHKKKYSQSTVYVYSILETEILTGSNFDTGATVEPLFEDDVFIFDIL